MAGGGRQRDNLPDGFSTRAKHLSARIGDGIDRERDVTEARAIDRRRGTIGEPRVREDLERGTVVAVTRQPQVYTVDIRSAHSSSSFQLGTREVTFRQNERTVRPESWANDNIGRATQLVSRAGREDRKAVADLDLI